MVARGFARGKEDIVVTRLQQEVVDGLYGVSPIIRVVVILVQYFLRPIHPFDHGVERLFAIVRTDVDREIDLVPDVTILQAHRKDVIFYNVYFVVRRRQRKETVLATFFAFFDIKKQLIRRIICFILVVYVGVVATSRRLRRGRVWLRLLRNDSAFSFAYVTPSLQPNRNYRWFVYDALNFFVKDVSKQIVRKLFKVVVVYDGWRLDASIKMLVVTTRARDSR